MAKRRKHDLAQETEARPAKAWRGAIAACAAALVALTFAPLPAAAGTGPHFESVWRACSKENPRRAFRGRAATIRHFNAVDACTRQRGGFSG